MIKFEHIETHGWEAATRGLRNPLNSWKDSDSKLTEPIWGIYQYEMGEKDLDLMQRLVSAGSDHGKFMRMIVVYMDITAPRYFHHQLDTYKVGTVKNSCSTMHTIHKREFTEDDFACSHEIMEHVLSTLEELRCEYLIAREGGHEEEAKGYWDSLTRLLPQSYIQKFTWMANYEVLKNIYHARKNHKLDEWRDFCEMIEELPYSQLITLKEVWHV